MRDDRPSGLKKQNFRQSESLMTPEYSRRFFLPGLGILALWVSVLTSCSSYSPDRYDSAEIIQSSALLKEARLVTRDRGLLAARELVEGGLARTDESGGEMERRIVRTTGDATLVLPDSLAALPEAKRKRIAIVIVPGTQVVSGKSSATRDVLRNASGMVKEMGFSTYFIDTPPRGGVSENAVQVAAQIAPIFATVDHVVLIMLSKGAHDVISYLQDHAMELPPAHRRKIDLVISLVGTVQGSVVADYFANGNRPIPVATRMSLALQGQRNQIRMLETIAASPWRAGDASRMREAFPDLTWLSLAMIPDGKNGRITERLWSPFVRWCIYQNSPYYSPADGLVETAASVLPDEVDFPEWIVPAYGSHAMANGHYADGTPVAPKTRNPGDESLNPESGGEVMSAYLRALPTSLLNHHEGRFGKF
jgi:hypothetical protein